MSWVTNADLSRQITALKGIIVTNQEHLEAGVAAIRANIATAVAELKAQIANGTPAADLDFTSLDKLGTDTAAEAAADAPPAPPA